MEVNTGIRVIAPNNHTDTALNSHADCYQEVGSQLTAMMLQLGNARSALRTNPEAVDTILAEMQMTLRETIRDIRNHSSGSRR